jgi:hypothetical protein
MKTASDDKSMNEKIVIFLSLSYEVKFTSFLSMTAVRLKNDTSFSNYICSCVQ